MAHPRLTWRLGAIARCTDQRRNDNEWILPPALQRVTDAIGHDNERSGSDRSRRLADAHGAFSGDDIDDFVTTLMDMPRDSLPHLQHADSLQRIARQNRFLEGFPPDEVSIEIINNRKSRGRPPGGIDTGGAGSGAGLGGGGGRGFITTSIWLYTPPRTVNSRSSVMNPSCSHRRRYTLPSFRSGTTVVPAPPVTNSPVVAPDSKRRTSLRFVPS